MLEFTQPIATLIAGGGVVTGAGLAFSSAERSRRQARAHHDDEQQAEKDRLRADRFSTSADQLGHTSPAVRTAGVYGLVSLADDWLAVGDRVAAQMVVDTLCGYLRIESTDATLGGEMNVRVAILNALKSRSNWWRRARNLDSIAGTARPWDELSTEVHHSFLAEIDLRHAQLAGVDLSDSYLGGAELGSADLEISNLTRANLTGAQCEGLYARGAVFESVIANQVNLTYATLVEVDLTDANLTGANLRFANFNGAILDGTVLDGAEVEGVVFTEEQLEGRRDRQSLVDRGANLRRREA